jgi:putative membrane protein
VSAVLLGLIAYSVARAMMAMAGIVRLPPIPGGLASLTVILTVFSLNHAWYSIGGRLTTLFFSLSAAISWAIEEGGVATGLVYGGYHYTSYLGPKLADVPLLIPLAWFMMIYPSYVVANLLIGRRAAGTGTGVRALVVAAAVSAVVMTAWDLVVDPILSGPTVRAWVWESGGGYFGVPIQNYFGWLGTTFIVYGAYRALEQRRAPAPLGPIDWRVASMPVAAYGLMLAGDLVSGVTPSGVVPIGLVVMGVPFTLAMWRVFELRANARPPEIAAVPAEA